MHIGKYLNQLVQTECLICKKTSDHSTPNLCTPCKRQLPYLTHRCRQCSMPIPEQDAQRRVCGQCLKHTPAFDQSFCPLRYATPVRDLLIKLKHQGDLSAASTLSHIFTEQYWQHRANNHLDHQNLGLPDLIIPIPLHWSRWLNRGFNQSACLAKLTAAELRIQLANSILHRDRKTQPQQGLSRKERLTNLRMAFNTSDKTIEQVEGKIIALFDDVTTTGTTMEEAAKCLKQAGASQVWAWSIARVC